MQLEMHAREVCEYEVSFVTDPARPSIGAGVEGRPEEPSILMVFGGSDPGEQQMKVVFI